MRKITTALTMMLLVACGDKKAQETPAPTPAPSGVEKVDKGTPPPIVAGEKARPAEKPTEVKVEEKPAEPEVKPAEPDTLAEVPVEPEVKAEEPAEAEVKSEEKPVEPEGATAIAPDLQVTDSALTSAVVDRMPSDRKTSWKIGEDTRLIGWFELKNPGTSVELELVWKKDGKENWRFPTNVGSGKNWRTWAEKRIGKRDAGRWTVELVDSNGHVYSSLEYTVE